MNRLQALLDRALAAAKADTYATAFSIGAAIFVLLDVHFGHLSLGDMIWWGLAVGFIWNRRRIFDRWVPRRQAPEDE